MDKYKNIVVITLILLISACGAKTVKDVTPVQNTNTVKTAILPPPPPPAVLKGSSFTEMDVFAGKTFTLTAQQMPLSQVLFAICTDFGMNLIIDPDIDSKEKITVNFNKTPAKDALELIMDVSNLFYEIKGNMFRVKKFDIKHFSIPHIPATTTYQSDLGGDVLGGSGDISSDLSSSLKGNFNISYKKPEGTGDFYKEIDENLKSILPATEGNFTMNRLTGTLTVYATRGKMEQVENFLHAVFKRATKQVQIEAKIIDVTLSDEWSYGIDWSAVLNNGKIAIGQTLALTGSTAGMVSVIADSFSGVISAIATYGKADTLSNPRLMVMNGQTALISAGTVTPFWEKETYQNVNNNTTLLNTNYTKYNVLDGILVGVTPYINDDGTVTINIVPVSTSIQGSKSIKNNNITEVEAPILNVKEAGTIIRVDNGALVVMGGLISTVKTVDNTRVPLLGDIPILGYLFRSQKETISKRELVIFLRPTIVYSSGEATK